jgi:hypothetical protein
LLLLVLLKKKSKPNVTYNASILKVTNLTFSVDEVEELRSINWKDIKAIFEKNESDEKNELTFKINLPESKNKIKGSITFGGKSKNIDELIKSAKKGIKGLIRIMNNNKKR